MPPPHITCGITFFIKCFLFIKVLNVKFYWFHLTWKDLQTKWKEKKLPGCCKYRLKFVLYHCQSDITDSFTAKCLKYHTRRVEEDTRRSCSECFPALFAQMLSFALISVPIPIHLECALKSGVSNGVTFIWPHQRWIFGSRTKRRVSGIKVWTARLVATLLWALATKWAD